MKIQIRYKSSDGKLHRSSASENEYYALDIRTKKGGRTCVSILPKQEIVLQSAVISMVYDYPEDCRIFVNGYQSWTSTREYELNEEVFGLNPLPKALVNRYHFSAYGDYWFRRYKRGELHGFSFAYMRDPEGNTDFFGSLNEENAYLVITFKKDAGTLTLESDCAGRKLKEVFSLFDFVRYRGSTYEVLHHYFDLFGKSTVPPIRGYTSWYLDYQNINEEKMRKTLESVDSDHFDLFQIDDGYETYVGDWLDVDPVKFPNGLEKIVRDIHEKGLKAGIWLAPFVCETKSRFFAEHPDWVYRKSSGEPVYAGSNWSRFCPLDIRKKEVRQYIRECLQYYKDAGFDFFKLDFLYAASMIRSSSYTRAELMRHAMIFLREELEGKLILGCGVPLASAFNVVDYCRVGPDVSLDFNDVFYMRIMHRERVSTKNTIQNTIFRHCMDGTVFRCDPDVYLLRDDNIRLTKEQKKALVLINHLSGSVYMTSDRVGDYDAEKKELLAEARELAKAKVKDVTKTGPVITIEYELNGQEQTLCYHIEKGILLH